jgi:hypothetical protein
MNDWPTPFRPLTEPMPGAGSTCDAGPPTPCEPDADAAADLAWLSPAAHTAAMPDATIEALHSPAAWLAKPSGQWSPPLTVRPSQFETQGPPCQT